MPPDSCVRRGCRAEKMWRRSKSESDSRAELAKGGQSFKPRRESSAPLRNSSVRAPFGCRAKTQPTREEKQNPTCRKSLPAQPNRRCASLKQPADKYNTNSLRIQPV